MDLSVLKASGRKLLELGRSCLHPDYRGGAAMMHLWGGLANYVEEHGIEILFGVASFHGTDVDALKAPLSLLHHRHLAPEAIRVRAQPNVYQSTDLMPESEIDRPAAMRAVPALIKRLSAAWRVRGRRCVCRSCLQHHRCLSDHRYVAGQ